jgi:hypothetical protein
MMSAKEGVESSAASGDSGATATFMRPERDDERVHNENDDDEAVYRVRVPCTVSRAPFWCHVRF